MGAHVPDSDSTAARWSATFSQLLSGGWRNAATLRQAVAAGLGPPGFPVPGPPAATTTELVRGPASAPFAIIIGPAPAWSGPRGSFGAASVWVAASLLSTDAPAGSWAGFAVSAGTMQGTVAPGGTPGTFVVAPGSPLVLSLALATAATAGAGPGGDARDATIGLPGSVELVFGDTQGEIADLGNGRLAALGASIRLAYGGAAVTYAADIGRLLIPMDHEPGAFAVSREVSTLVTLAGQAPIAGAGWALPVTVAAPAGLGTVTGNGALALQLAAGLSMTWQDQPQPVTLGSSWLLAAPGQLTVASAAAAGGDAVQQLTLYPSPAGAGVGGLLRAALAGQFGLLYECDASGDEILLFTATASLSLDRPVTVSGNRVAIADGQATLALLQQASGTTLLALVRPAAGGAGAVLALDNALLTVGAPDLVLLDAALVDGAAVTSGAVVLSFPLARVIPILPDPYAANIVAGPVMVAPRAAAQRAAAPPPAAGAIPVTIPVIGAPPAPAAAAAGPAVQALVSWDNTGAGGPALSFALGTDSEAAAVSAAAPAETRAAAPAAAAGTSDAGLLAELAAESAKALGAEPGAFALLDVSTAADLFGVRFGPAAGTVKQAPDGALLGGVTAAAGADPVATITGLDVAAPAHRLRVITLPAVQWEPVTAPGETGTFSPMTFADSGGETQLASRSVRLVPAAPLPALRQLVADFNNEADPVGAVASLTFPFGMRAVAVLNPVTGTAPNGATVGFHQPQFTAVPVTGGYQVRAVAVNPAAELSGGSAGFPGAMVQLSNGLHNGVATGLSPIDPLTGIFNSEFAPGGFAPGVPVESFDVSGYGETAFSTWLADDDDAVSISQVRFDVVTGRSIIEIVQARSVLFPYAARVIRTIKLLRDNSGRVYRTDSGWQAATDGTYDWPRADLRTHPGVVLAAARITNIRDTGQRWTSSLGTELGAVRFDCMMQLDGVTAGGTADGVASRDQLGFVQLTTTNGNAMSPAEFAELLAAFGPLGGAVEATVNLGGTGQGMRIGHVGAGATQGMTGPEFAMAGWGSPVFPQGGNWSVLVQPAGSPSPQPVDPSLGAPVIRAGYAGVPADPASPFRLADPQDLATPASPAADYGLVNSQDTQRVLFPRPKIDLTGARAAAWSSTRPPLLADPYDMATANGLFPDNAHVIPFPDADYGLEPRPGGNLALSLAHNDFPVPGGDHVLHDNGHMQLFARFQDENGTPSTVHVEIDSTQPVPWVFRLDGVELGVSTTGLGEIMRLLGSIQSSAAQPTVLTGATTHFGGCLTDVQELISFLGDNPVPADIPFAQRNLPTLDVGLKIPFLGAPGEDDTLSLGILTVRDADFTVGWKVDLKNGDTVATVDFEAVATINTPWPPLVAAGQFRLEIETGDAGNDLLLTVGLGVGVVGTLAGFKAYAMFFATFYLEVADTNVGLGIGAELKGKVDLDVVEIDVDIEARGIRIDTSCAAGQTKWIISQVSVGLEVTIAWVIDIDFEYQAQWENNTNHGPCPAP